MKATKTAKLTLMTASDGFGRSSIIAQNTRVYTTAIKRETSETKMNTIVAGTVKVPCGIGLDRIYRSIVTDPQKGISFSS